MARRRGWVWLAVLGVVALAGAIGPSLLRAQEDAGSAEQDGADGGEAAPDGGGPAAAEAEAAEEDEDSGPAVDVTVGVYVNQIREVSIRENHFDVDFWIWFRWPKSATRQIDPLATFEVVGGDIESKTSEVREDLGEFNYVACRVVAKVIRFFDIRNFPQDDHVITLVIEDSANEDHKVRFIADVQNSRLDPGVRAPGFRIAGASSHLTTHTYTTNYGDVTLPSNAESRYSRFEFRVKLERPGFGYAMKLLWGLWLSGLVAFVAFFIKPIDVDPRFGLGVGALFAAMANQYIVSEALPDTAEITTADQVGMIAIGFIFLSVVQSAVSLWMAENDRETISKKLDLGSAVVFTVAYVICNLVTVL